MRLPVNRFAALGLLTVLAACGHGRGDGQPGATLPVGAAAQGPAADYPMVLGAPFTVDGVTFSPVDALNYDHVGLAVAGSDGGNGITLAHRTLPLPSYVEVTSLRTGKTILARVERRGPMAGSALAELSPGAAAQFGEAADRLPVRVRRVNPPEVERALLRSGQAAPARMDTPMSLVAVLSRKLDPALAPASATPPPAAAVVSGPAPATPAKPQPQPAKQVAVTVPSKGATKASDKAPDKPRAKAAARPAAADGRGAYVVQVGAFASADGAARAARQVGGASSPAGKFHRVRITGFASAADARAALAKAKGAGYSDARIQRAD